MAHDVFISHTRHDKLVADAACAVLEKNGIRCWIAPRDVVPGQDFAVQISRAIKDCWAMVIIFSGHTNDSPHVRSEITSAFDKGKILLPLRIEEIIPAEGLDHFLGGVHWLDAFTPPMEQHLQRMADILLGRRPIGKQPTVPVATPPMVAAVVAPPPQPPPTLVPKLPAKPIGKQLLVVLGIVVLILGLVWLGMSLKPSGNTPTSPAPSPIPPNSAFVPVTAISAGGDDFSLFLKSDGSLWGMGDNSFGQLGDGTTTERHTPVQIVANGVTAIATGDDDNLFIKSDGSLWGMGDNSFGQLGDGTTTERHTPCKLLLMA